MIGEVNGEIILNLEKWRRVAPVKGTQPTEELLKEYKKIGGATMKVEEPKKVAKKTTKKVVKKKK